MKKQLLYLLSIILLLNCCSSNTNRKIVFQKLEMYLSAFGVESDSFPSIDSYIDFVNDSGICKRSYYNPAIKGSTYKLSDSEIKKLLQLLQTTNLSTLKEEYKGEKDRIPDQPTSDITIYTTRKDFTIKDYGLGGNYPLKELYKTVYKLY